MLPRVGLEPTQGCPYQIYEVWRVYQFHHPGVVVFKKYKSHKMRIFTARICNYIKRDSQKMVRLARLELARVASPPPQDGVSTIPPQPRLLIDVKIRPAIHANLKFTRIVKARLQQWICVKHDDCDN